MKESDPGRLLGRPSIWGSEVTGIAADGPNDRFALPAGTVTFLLSDIEGSTALWEREPEAMAEAVPGHYEMLAEAVAHHGGVRPVEQGEGDSIVGAFPRATDAVTAALAAQRALHGRDWPQGIQLKVRIALHTADAQLRDEGNYFGAALSRCARLRAIAYGGQIVLSRATHDLVVDRLPAGAELVDRGTHRLRDLGRPEQVFAVTHPDLPAETRPLRSLDSFPNNLPVRLTTFVGRERELQQVREALSSTRLLTLTGAGGCGKTRLALQAAADALDLFPDGAWWVELAPVTDPALVEEALAEALGLRLRSGVTALQAACANLGGRRALVVLDNCEHLLDGCAQVADALLHACPNATVMATSRAPLGVESETDWRVPSLSVPPERAPEPIDALTQFDAVRLFIDRARKVRPNFAVTNANAPAVAQVCVDLEGIPLALELAAARVRVLSVEQIAQALGDRFHLLTGGARGAVPRHQTLRASVDWSHDLLSDAERLLFRRLAVFTGGFTLDAAETICADDSLDAYAVLDLLTSLVDKSLVVADDRGPAVRYRMLETVRQYALERLVEAGEADAVRDRHRDAYAELALRLEPELLGTQPLAALEVLDDAAANVAAALDRATEADPELALRMCAALHYWWRLRGMLGAAETAHARALAAAPPTPTSLRARVLWSRAFLLLAAGSAEACAESAREAYDAADASGDQVVMGRALNVLGTIQAFPDPHGARGPLKRARELASAAGDDLCFIDSSQMLAFCSLWEADYEPAIAALDEALPVIERAGYRDLTAWHWTSVGFGEWLRGDLATARELHARGLEVAREVGEPVSGSVASIGLAYVEIARGDAEAALARLFECGELVRATGAGMAAPDLVVATAWAQAAAGNLDAARATAEAALSLTDGYAWGGALALLALGQVLRLQGDLDGAAKQASAVRDVAPPRNAWLRARAVHLEGLVAAARHEWATAEAAMNDALAMQVERGYRLEIPELLEGLAEVAAGLESHEEAARLLAAAARAHADLGTAPIGPERGRLERIAASLREALGEEPFAAAWREGEAMTMDDAVQWARRARGERRRPSRGWESLTPTEARVVELARGGLTNPEIAERMFVTSGTVKTHLAHIYDKLGIKNRTELAALAAERATEGARPR